MRVSLVFGPVVHVFTLFTPFWGIWISFLPPGPNLLGCGQALHDLVGLPPGGVRTLDEGEPVLALLHELGTRDEECLVVRDRAQRDATSLGDLPLTKAVAFGVILHELAETVQDGPVGVGE